MCDYKDMKTLVDRLRWFVPDTVRENFSTQEELMDEAANEIERLRKHIVLLEMAFSKALGKAVADQAVKNLFETGSLSGGKK